VAVPWAGPRGRARAPPLRGQRLEDPLRDLLVSLPVRVVAIRAQTIRPALKQVEGRDDEDARVRERGFGGDRVPLEDDRGSQPPGSAVRLRAAAEGIVEAEYADGSRRIGFAQCGEDRAQITRVIE